MPEAPMPAPAQAAAAPAEGEGGGVADAIVQVDATLMKLAQAAAESPQVPPEAKAAVKAASDAFRQFASILTGAGEGPAPGGPVGPATPEQGGSGARPVGMGRPA